MSEATIEQLLVDEYDGADLPAIEKLNYTHNYARNLLRAQIRAALLESCGMPEAQLMAKYAQRYHWLRTRNLDTINDGGIFAGQTPQNIVLNGEDLDQAIDAAISAQRVPKS